MMKRVAVIGAGAAGLAALRVLSRFTQYFEFKAFEQSDRVGGTWVHNDIYKPSSMYDNLLTNLPKEVMAFPNFPFKKPSDRSYIAHQEVHAYLEDFACHYDLQQYIKFLTAVMSVEKVHASGPPMWNICVRTGLECYETSQFDAIMICNGHYTVPMIPEIDGSSTFNGELIHCHFYRKPEVYADKIVLVLGAGPSGIDIALDLAPHAKMVYLSHNAEPNPSVIPENVVQVVGLKSLSNTNALLNDHSMLEVDVVMYATGYKADFPFFTQSEQPTIHNGRFTTLYRAIVDVENPSLFHIGLNHHVVPFPQFDLQCEYVSAVLRGEIVLPDKKAMLEAIEEDYQEKTVKVGKAERHHHRQQNQQWEYNTGLARDSKVADLPPNIAKMYTYSSHRRNTDVMNFKKIYFEVVGLHDFTAKN